MKIKNTSLQVLVIPLNSGRAIHLAPEEASELLSEEEVTNNPTVKKLTDKNWISLIEKKVAKPPIKPIEKKEAKKGKIMSTRFPEKKGG